MSHDLPYLRLLAQQYPTIQSAATAIIERQARLHLPKGTDHYLSDLHGAYEPFRHVLKNASGSIRRKIDDTFGTTLSYPTRRDLATLIYYPEQKLPLLLKTVGDNPDHQREWLQLTIYRLIKVCRNATAKYTSAQVTELMPKSFEGILSELLIEQEHNHSKQSYYQNLINSVIDTGSARAFVVCIATLIQRLAIARLHIIGDIYDRGPGAHLILDELMEHHAVDIQWGNHDIVWMGAAAGSGACIANVIRIALRYANMETIENGYAISLLPLATLAMELYGNDPCKVFIPRDYHDTLSDNERELMAKMHKALAIIQFKLEGKIIQRRTHFEMEDRLLLDKIDLDAGTVLVNGISYPMLDTHFPTLDPANPYELTPAEANVVEKLKFSFTQSERLQKHVRFLFAKGSMYLRANGLLLYHGCIPMTENGDFEVIHVGGQEFAGKKFMDRVERLCRQGYFTEGDSTRKRYGEDVMWYLWAGARSPLFGKKKMATFERYFIADKATHAEAKNPYYKFRDQEETARRILTEFGCDPENSSIVNGHVPVEVKRGESPVKAGGKLLVIDGGMSEAYQPVTGIAGYTLIYNSYGMVIASHKPFTSTQTAIIEGLDIHSETRMVEQVTQRRMMYDTDEGQEIKEGIAALTALLDAYRQGLIKERVVQ